MRAIIKIKIFRENLKLPITKTKKIINCEDVDDANKMREELFINIILYSHFKTTICIYL